jgi:hypothetical protein
MPETQPNEHRTATPTSRAWIRIGVLVGFGEHTMLFTKKLRTRVKSGEVTASVRIWKTPRVKAGSHYRLDEGHIEVISIRQIVWEDLTDKLARDTGFKNLVDMLKTAKHGSGQNVYHVRFQYAAGPARPATENRVPSS